VEDKKPSPEELKKQIQNEVLKRRHRITQIALELHGLLNPGAIMTFTIRAGNIKIPGRVNGTVMGIITISKSTALEGIDAQVSFREGPTGLINP